MLIPDRADFRTRKMIRDKYGHYIMIKGTSHQEDITVINTYAPSIGALFATPWTVARQAPLSMGFSRQDYWSG